MKTNLLRWVVACAATIALLMTAKADDESCGYLESTIASIGKASQLAVRHVEDLHTAHFVVSSDIEGEKNRSCVLKKAQLINGNGLPILQAFGPNIELVRRTFDGCKSTIEEGNNERFSEDLVRFVKDQTRSEAIEYAEGQFEKAKFEMILAQGKLTPAMLAFFNENPSILDDGYGPDCGTIYDDVRAKLEQSVTSGYVVRRLGEFSHSDLSPKSGSDCAALPERMYKKIDSSHYPLIGVSQFEFDRWVGEDQDYFAIEGGRLFWHKDRDYFFALEGLHFYLQTGFTMKEALKFLQDNPIKDPNNPLTDEQKRMMAAYHKYADIAATASYESVGLDTPVLCGDGSELARFAAWNERLHGLNKELGLGRDLRHVPKVFKR
ncbi:MAG: hypothetical protein AAF004_02540 [Pseudomonadota bacterium]